MSQDSSDGSRDAVSRQQRCYPVTGSRDCIVWFQDSSFKNQVSSKLLPNIFPCLEGSTERSDGSLGRSLREIAMAAHDRVSRLYCMVSGFKFQDSGFRIQVSSKLLPNIFPCLEGSTERSDGSLGQCLRTAAMVAWDAVSGRQRWYPVTGSRDCIVWFQDSSFKIQVSGFRFQASYYPTFFPAWKAVLSVAMAAWDAVSGK